MGWASYFEDNWRRWDESEFPAAAMVGPPGTPNSRPATLLKCFDRIQRFHETIGPQIVQRYHNEKWPLLCRNMADIEREIQRFQRITLMCGYDNVMATAGQIEQRLHLILSQARSVIEFLDNRLHDLFTDLQYVEGIIRRSKVELPPRETQLQQKGLTYYKGLEELKNQYAELCDQKEELQMLLASHLLERLMGDPSYVIQDKDASVCFKRV